MKEPNDDFLNHIISTLRKHEEPYEEGAWERFKTARKVETKARPVIIGLWKWGAAAAAAVTAIFLISKIYFSSNNNIDTNLPINIVTNNTEKITKDSGKTTAIAASPEVKKYGETEHQKSPVARIIATPANRTAANINHENINDISTSAPSPFITTPSRQPATLPEVAQQEPPKKNDRIDFWRNKIIEGNEQPKQTTIKPENNILLSTTQPSIKQVPSKEKNKRWQPSLYVSPLFNDQGVDMGYGFSLGYAINDKIKISSGIAHTKL